LSLESGNELFRSATLEKHLACEAFSTKRLIIVLVLAMIGGSTA
jgi:hypothetical protein